LRAQIQLGRPVFHLKARGALNSLSGRARITTRKCDAISDGPGADYCVPREHEICPTLAAPAASRVTPPSRALLPARPARELLSRYALRRFYERHRLGPRGRHRSRRQNRMGERNAPSRISSPSLRRFGRGSCPTPGLLAMALAQIIVSHVSTKFVPLLLRQRHRELRRLPARCCPRAPRESCSPDMP